jgi:hypothetical protein
MLYILEITIYPIVVKITKGRATMGDYKIKVKVEIEGCNKE